MQKAEWKQKIFSRRKKKEVGKKKEELMKDTIENKFTFPGNRHFERQEIPHRSPILGWRDFELATIPL